MNVSDINEGFQEALQKVQTQEVGLILEVVEVVEDTSLSRFLRRRPTTEVLNNRLESLVIDSKN